MVGRFIVHGTLLHADYAKPESEAQQYFHLMIVAHVIMAGAFVWIYSRGPSGTSYPSTSIREGAMRRFASCCIAVALIGCGKPADKPADDTMGEAPAGISLADVAGTWSLRTMPESGDSTLVTYEMVVGADGSGWSITFPKRDPIPVRVVAVEGDSIVTEAGPFESVLRKGVQVTTHQVFRLQDGKLMGTTVARYAVSGPDTVARLRFEGTRAP